MKKIFYTLSLCLLLPLTALEVRKLTPPQLDSSHVGGHILCHRPVREESPCLTLERAGDQIIIHNYGHGGSGWTLGPGTVHYCYSLLASEGIDKSAPVAIIGAGCIGLFTAYHLVQENFTNITIYASSFDNLTSHNAGGLLAPACLNCTPDLKPLINHISCEAYRFYQQIALGRDPVFRLGARILPVYFPTREDSGLEPYVGSVMEPAKDVLVDFGKGTSRLMVVYDDGIFIDTSALMKSLHELLKDKVTFKKETIENMATLSEKLIFNCTGMGAKALNKDEKVISFQGHLITLKDQNPSDLDYMLCAYHDEGLTSTGKKIKRASYFLPKQVSETDIGVIGGTFIEGADESTPHEEEFDIVLENARNYFGSASILPSHVMQ